MSLAAEAKKITEAFGIVESCSFAYGMEPDVWELRERSQSHILPGRRNSIHTTGGLAIDIIFDARSKYFSLISDGPDGTLLHTEIALDITSNSVLIEPCNCEHSYVMAKGLFHLGLLSPQVERALKTTVSAHEKMLWALEFSDSVPAC